MKKLKRIKLAYKIYKILSIIDKYIYTKTQFIRDKKVDKLANKIFTPEMLEMWNDVLKQRNHKHIKPFELPEKRYLSIASAILLCMSRRNYNCLIVFDCGSKRFEIINSILYELCKYYKFNKYYVHQSHTNFITFKNGSVIEFVYRYYEDDIDKQDEPLKDMPYDKAIIDWEERDENKGFWINNMFIRAKFIHSYLIKNIN